MDKELYQKLAGATKYLQLVEDGCALILSKQEEAKELEKNHKAQRYKKKAPFEKFIWIFSWLSLVSFIGIIGAIIVKSVYYTIIISLLFALFLSIFIFIIVSEKRVDKKFAVIYENETKPKIMSCISDIEQIKEAVERFGEANKHVLDFLPHKYRNLEAASYMLMVVVDQRAETFKEALNLYEEQLHRWRLEDAAQNSIEAQEYIALALDELNDRQAETNAHLSAIEQMQFIEYIHK